jgi:hypothetical protein
MDVYAHARKRSLVTTVRDEAIWRYDMDGRAANVNRTWCGSSACCGWRAGGYLVTPVQLEPGAVLFDTSSPASRGSW